MTFEELGLNEQLIEGISYMGFENATPIQEMAIPKILAGKDLIACAQTGTGKTAAFTLPMLHLLTGKETPGISTLIICPTRELAIQIDNQIQAFAYFAGVHSIAVYGGGGSADWDNQKNALVSGADIIVATPGKLISHINMGYVDFSALKYLILDEADRMLDMGFMDDIQFIIKQLPKKRQTLMFSATMASKIKTFASKFLNSPDEISIALAKPAAGILQAAYLAYDAQKIDLLDKLIYGKEKYKSILVFSSTKKNVGNIVRALKRKKYDAAGISSDLEQKEREAVLRRFTSKSIRILVATDVLSRGIDIKDINLVINYDVPKEAADYVHRVGRTARADTTGVAISFINPDDMPKFDRIEKLIERKIVKSPLPEGIGEAPKWNPKGQRHSSGGGRYKGGGGRKNYSKKR